MSRSPLITLAAVAFCFAGLGPTPGLAQPPIPPRADTAFQLTTTRDPDRSIRLHWTIAPETHLYRDKITVTDDAGVPLPAITEPGTVADDPIFGSTEIYHGSAEARVAGGNLDKTRSIVVGFQGCADVGICYPPISRVVDLDALIATAGADRAAAPAPDPTRGLLSGSAASVAAAFFGFGLLLAFTPCVFPMVPILAGILTRSGDRLSVGRGFAVRLSVGRGFAVSAAYVVAMALAYAALGVAAAWSGRNLQVALQTPLALGAMTLVLTALAASMFGLFELRLPTAWTSRLARLSGGSRGSLLGAAGLGFTSALIVGPCVTPPLAAALLFVAETGEIVRGAGALFALGLGMGLPLLLAGTFGAGLLPKSGAWLRGVNQIFGFVFLGLAVTMLARVVPEGVASTAWGTLAIAAGIRAALTGLRLARAAADGLRLAAVMPGAVLLVGGAIVVVDTVAGPLPIPPWRSGGTSIADAGAIVASPAAFDAAVAVARTDGRPILVDFSADWCTVCREIDRTVLADASVRDRLGALSVIRADVTRDDDGSRALMRRFGVVGPPTLVFLDARTGAEVSDARLIGAVSVADFHRSLDRAHRGS